MVKRNLKRIMKKYAAGIDLITSRSQQGMTQYKMGNSYSGYYPDGKY